MNKLEYTKSDLIELQELCDSLSNKVDFLIDRNDEKQEVLDKIKEYIEHENYKRNILLGLSEKKYTRDILNHIL